jgi:hypothetical protein
MIAVYQTLCGIGSNEKEYVLAKKREKLLSWKSVEIKITVQMKRLRDRS